MPVGNVPFLFEVSDVHLTVPQVPEFTELSYSFGIERVGKPETRFQTRWFSSSIALEERGLNSPMTAWADDAKDYVENLDQDSNEAGTLSTSGTPTSQQREHSGSTMTLIPSADVIQWSRVNAVQFSATLHPIMEGVSFRQYAAKREHPLVVYVKVSPRHPSMGITQECTSTRTWSTLVNVDLAQIASAPNGEMTIEFSLSKAPRNDSTASSHVLADVKLTVTFRATLMSGTLIMAPPPLWPNFVSRYPYVFIIDQFVMTGRFAALSQPSADGRKHSGAGATQQVVLENKCVRVEVVRKHGEAGIVRRVTKGMPTLPESSRSGVCSAQMDVQDSHIVTPVKGEDLAAMELQSDALRRHSAPSPAALRRQAQRSARCDARCDGDSIAVLDEAIPDGWFERLMAAGDSGAQPSLPLKVIKLRLETDAVLGQIMPRDSKRTHLMFSHGDAGAAPVPWKCATSAPVSVATQFYGFENFPERGFVMFQNFEDFVELRFRVRRLLLGEIASEALGGDKVATSADFVNTLRDRRQ